MPLPSPATAPTNDARYGALFGQALVGVAQTDLTGRFVDANARYLEIVGRTAAELRGLRMQDLTHPDDLDRNLAAFHPLVEGRGEPFVVEKRYVRPDGTTVWVHNSVSLVCNAEGPPKGVVAVTIDVTERRRAEEELRRANAALEREVAERAAQIRVLSRALTEAEQDERRRIAHVLHDDLQPTLAGAQIAAAQGDLDRLEGILERATRTARTLSHSLSPPLRQSERLGDLLAWLAVRKRELHGLEVALDVRSDAAVRREDLRVLLYHLLREVLFNVVKHAGVKRARLSAARAVSPAGPVARVVVEDEGAGFDTSMLDRTSPSGGLGLPSVRERLEIVGGRFEVASSPGAGTRVTIEVPADA